MRIRFWSYRIIITSIAAIVMLAWVKIDRIGFFNHYFKVIEEVEIRNSTALSPSTSLLKFSSEQISTSFLGGLWLGIMFFCLAFFVGQFIKNEVETDFLSWTHTSLARLHPVRAP